MPDTLQLLPPWILIKTLWGSGLLFIYFSNYHLDEERKAERVKQSALGPQQGGRGPQSDRQKLGQSILIWVPLCLIWIPTLPLLATVPRASHLNSLCLSFLNCNVGMRGWIDKRTLVRPCTKRTLALCLSAASQEATPPRLHNRPGCQHVANDCRLS